MLEKEYSVLGVFSDASDEEIEQNYLRLKKKYEEERFLDGEQGNMAARKLTELNAAYESIKTYRKEHSDNDNYSGLYKQVDDAIKSNNLQRAQELLDSFNERDAEWHYLQAVVFYKRNWTNESKKQLEIAKDMEPLNEKYEQTYKRLIEKINKGGNSSNGEWNKSYSSGGNGAPVYGDEPQMGGDSCFDFCCRMAICNACLNCFCNGCCR